MTVLPPQRNITLLAVMRTPETGRAVSQALPARPGLRLALRVAPTAAEVATAVAEGGGDLLLAEIDPDDAADIDALREGLHGRQPPPTIVACPPPGVEAMRALMRLGVADLVAPPFAAPDLAAAVDATLEKLPPLDGRDGQQRRGRCISVLKACGGAGATTLAVNLADHLARRGKGGDPALLVDLDVQFGSVALHLDLNPKLGVLDLLAEPSRLDIEMLRAGITTHPSGIQVLAAPTEVVPVDVVMPEAAEALITLATQSFETVLVDLPGVWTPWTRAVLAASDAVILVTSLTVPSVRHALRQIRTLGEEGLGHVPVVPVANREHRGFLRRNPLAAEAEKVLERKIVHLVPSDYAAVSAALNAGRTLHEAGAARPVRKAIARLADAVAPAPAARRA